MIKHIVLWKFSKDSTEEDRLAVAQAFREKVEYLGTIIPEIKSATVGWNLSSGDVYHVILDSVFEDAESLDRYINHPEHLKVRAFINGATSERTVFDYKF